MMYVALIGAGCLLLIDLLLTVALTAAGALSQVALHRMSQENGDRLEFLDEMQKPSSTHRSTSLPRWSSESKRSPKPR